MMDESLARQRHKNKKHNDTLPRDVVLFCFPDFLFKAEKGESDRIKNIIAYVRANFQNDMGKKEMPKFQLSERILEEDYPIYINYVYVADGLVVRSDIQGTVADLRRDLERRGLSANTITSCDIFTRQAMLRE